MLESRVPATARLSGEMKDSDRLQEVENKLDQALATIDAMRAEIAELRACHGDVPVALPSLTSIGQFGAGRNKGRGSVDIGMLQSLQSKGTVRDVVANYGHVLIDECHHVPAFSFEAVLKEVKAKYVTGLTATPVRKDGHHPIVIMQYGPGSPTLRAHRGASADVNRIRRRPHL